MGEVKGKKMIRVDVISKSDAVRRIAKGLPAYGIVWCWDEIVAVDLLNGSMRKCILHKAKMRLVKTTKTFYRYYQHSEEEYWKKINGEPEQGNQN